MDATLYDSRLSNIIAFYGVLATITVPVIILLIESLKNSPKIDKQVLYNKVFLINRFTLFFAVITIIMLQILLFNSSLLSSYIIGIFVAILVAVFSCYFVNTILKMIMWIFSGENKEPFHNYYRQNLRIEYLKDGTVEERNNKWYQFWLDENAIKYFSNDICNYIEAFFSFLSEIKDDRLSEENKSCVALFYKIPDLYKVGRNRVKIYPYDERSFVRQLIKTVPYSFCDMLVDNLDDFKNDKKPKSFWCAMFLTSILTEMSNDKNLKNSEWFDAFNLFFFGMNKSKKRALIIARLITSHYEHLETKTKARQIIKRMMNMCDRRYKKFYQQLDKEIYRFNPKDSKLVIMIEEGVKDE